MDWNFITQTVMSVCNWVVIVFIICVVIVVAVTLLGAISVCMTRFSKWIKGGKNDKL